MKVFFKTIIFLCRYVEQIRDFILLVVLRIVFFLNFLHLSEKFVHVLKHAEITKKKRSAKNECLFL